jgi:hypothetical protein
VSRIGGGRIGGAPGGGTGVGGSADYGHRPTNAIETMPRLIAAIGTPSHGAGVVGFTYFTPDISLTVTTLTTATRGVAGVGITLARMALYTVAADGALTLAARTAADATLWTATNTVYTRPIAENATGAALTSYAVTAGIRYAFATLHVGSTTAPNMPGLTGMAPIEALTPRMFGYLTGQTDMPATVAAATINANTASANTYYGRLA